MKFRHRIKFTVDNMLLHSSQMRAVILMDFITFMVLALVIVLNRTTGNFHKETQAAFAEDISNVGYISLDDSYETYFRYLEAMHSQDYITMAGSFATYETYEDAWADISAFQSGNKRTNIENSNVDVFTEIIYIDKNAFGLFDIELKDGYLGTDEVYEKGYIPLYVGYKYKKMLDIGDTIVNGREKPFMVAGYIKKNQVVPIDDLTYVDKYSLNTTTSLDYGMVAVTEETPDYFMIYFGIKEGYEFSDVRYRLTLLAEREGVSDVRIANVAAVVDSADESTKSIRRYLLDLFVIVAISACVALTCYQSMNIITRKYEYGILYANGFNETDMIFMIIAESLIKMIIAVILVMPILAVVGKFFFETMFETQRILNEILFRDALTGVLLAGLLITAVSAIFPIMMIKKSSASELIGDKL